MNLPNYEFFMRSVLETLSHAESLPNKKAVQAVLGQHHFSHEELAVKYDISGDFVLADRVEWAITYLKNAGLIASPARGVLRITEEGKKALLSGNEINNAYLMRYDSFIQYMKRSRRKKSNRKMRNHTESSLSAAASSSEDDYEDSHGRMSEACGTPESELKEEILSILGGLKESEFVRFCVDLLVKMGCCNPALDCVLPEESGDVGIAASVTSDPLGFDKVYVQAKLCQAEGSISEGAIRDFIGAIDTQESNGRGVFITTGKFANGAVAQAIGSRHHKIMLIDGGKLADLVIKFEAGVVTVATCTVKKTDPAFYARYGRK